MGLTAIPRAARPKGADELVESDELLGHRRGEGRDPQRCQMVGIDRPVEVVPGDLPHALVRQPEMGQDGDRLAGRHVRGQLDGREDRAIPALGDDQGAVGAGGVDGEGFPVDDANPGRHRIDAQPVEGEVEERERGPDDEGELACGHRRVGPQQLDRPLRHRRRARDGIDDVIELVERRPPVRQRSSDRPPRRSLLARSARRTTWPRPGPLPPDEGSCGDKDAIWGLVRHGPAGPTSPG